MMRLMMRLSAIVVLAWSMVDHVQADQVLGSSVTGSIFFNGGSTNYFDPQYGYVPADTSNSAGTTVTISDTMVEFGFNTKYRSDTADFTGTQLTLTNLTESNGSTPYQVNFTDAAFSGFSLVSNTFDGLTYSFTGSTLTVNAGGYNGTTPYTRTAVFDINPAVTTPEPSTLILAAWGVPALFGMGYRRYRRRMIA